MEAAEYPTNCESDQEYGNFTTGHPMEYSVRGPGQLKPTIGGIGCDLPTSVINPKKCFDGGPGHGKIPPTNIGKARQLSMIPRLGHDNSCGHKLSQIPAFPQNTGGSGCGGGGGINPKTHGCTVQKLVCQRGCETDQDEV